jgi:hypothetical protein
MKANRFREVAVICLIVLACATGCSDDDVAAMDAETFAAAFPEIAALLGGFLDELDPLAAFQGEGSLCPPVEVLEENCETGNMTCTEGEGTLVYDFNNCTFSEDELGLSGKIDGDVTYSTAVFNGLGGPTGARDVRLTIHELGSVKIEIEFLSFGFSANPINPNSGQPLTEFPCQAYYDGGCCLVSETCCEPEVGCDD